MDPIPLTPLDPQGLLISSNERDVLRDLFVYLDYVQEHQIKRMARTNDLPRGDVQRIARLMGNLAAQPRQAEVYAERWIGFIDALAYHLKLVDYDIKGVYRGVRSEEPTFFDNYMNVMAAQVRQFLERTPRGEEKSILDTLIAPLTMNAYGDQEVSEFYGTSLLGRLDPFDAWGSATGVMPSLKFPEIRHFLIDLLAQCTPGVWYSSASLVAYLKAHHPYFLIPQKIPADKWGRSPKRYDNFHEGTTLWNARENTVPEDAPDAFERVEGRYVERFLENVPLILRLVDVAYEPQPNQGIRPMREVLKAFRVNERLARLMSGEDLPPQVTVQPNLDVVIQSEFYPARVIQQIGALGEQTSGPASGGAYVVVYQLKKTCVAAERARHPDLDVVGLLRDLSGRDLPPNVQVELEEWTGHADQFTLYEGFSLLESAEEIPAAEAFTRERITSSFRLVKDAGGLFRTLERDGCVPLRVRHSPEAFTPLADQAVSVFPRQRAREETVETPAALTISRAISITVKFPGKEPFDAFSKILAELRCPFQSDHKSWTITFDEKYQAKFDEAIQRLAHVYAVQIE
jgi:hypothetical protein